MSPFYKDLLDPDILGQGLGLMRPCGRDDHTSTFALNKISGHLTRFKTQNIAVQQEKPTYRSRFGTYNRALN